MLSTPDVRTLGVLGAVLISAVIAVFGLVRWSGREQVSGTDPVWRELTRSWIALVALTWVLLVFGASVRVNAAGLACPDWPLCFGRLVPEHDWKVFLEFWHRLYAGGVSLIFLFLSARMLRNPEQRKMFGPHLLLAALALAAQIVLGGLTVLHLLAEWTVTSHLLGGNTFCLMLALVALRVADKAAPVARDGIPSWHRIFSVILGVAVVAQVALGGLVSSSHAGLACGTWPTCDGYSWFPTWAGLVGLQLTHRCAAYLLLLLTFVGAFVFRGRAAVAARTLLGVVIVQATIGVANVLLYLPVEVTLLHTAGAALAFLSMGWLNFETWSAPLVARQRAASPESNTVGNLRAEGL